jgi:cytochrome c-type biogenesis protein CcmF
VVLAVAGVRSLGAACGLGLAAWLFAATATEMAERVHLFREPMTAVLRRARHLPRAAWGMTFAHAGMAIVIAGITGSTAWTEERIVNARPGESVNLAGYTIALDAVNQVKGPDYTATRADMRLLRDGSEIALLHPEKRFYTGENGAPATGVAIRTNLFADIYAVIGDPDGKGGYVLRLYWNPLVPWIWLGAAAMALGGLISLSDRRHRVGAPARRARPPKVAAAGNVQAAD